MKDLSKTELNEERKKDLDAVTRSHRLISNSSFLGAGAKSVVSVLDFLESISIQLTKEILQNQQEEDNGKTEE